MKVEELGKLIVDIQERKLVSAVILCKGICTPAAFSKMKNGTVELDFLSLQCLLSRLGMSVNKMEVLFQSRIYEIFMLREKIEEAVRNGQLSQAAEFLEKYRAQEEMEKPIFRQYYHKLHTVICYQRKEDASLAAAELKEALELTLPDISVDRIGEYLLSEEEWVLFFMWLEQRSLAGDAAAAEDCKKLFYGMQKSFFDEEVWASVYPKLAWLYLEKGKVTNGEEAEICGDVVKILTHNGLLTCLPQFLTRYLRALEKMADGDTKKVTEIRKQREALVWAYEEAGVLFVEDKLALWDILKQFGVYLLPEVIRMERQSRNHSQEELADIAELDWKTLSRIETGANSPKPGTLKKIREALDAGWDVYNTAVITEKYALLELERDLTREISVQRYEKAEQIFDELCSKLNMEKKENRQYVLYRNALLATNMGEMSKQESVQKLKKAFEITRKYDEDTLSKITLSRNENTIVHLIAKMYREQGEEKKAIELLKKVLQGYDASRLNQKYHYREISILLLSLASYCETSDLFEEALNYCERGISLQHQCQRGNMLPRFVLQKYFILDRQGKDKQECKRIYQKIYQLTKLVESEASTMPLEKYYKKQYGIEIDEN